MVQISVQNILDDLYSFSIQYKENHLANGESFTADERPLKTVVDGK